MASTRQFIRSWSGGEIAPELFGRLDDARYQQGAEKLRNFIGRLGGSLQRRPGFDYVRATKDSGSKRSRLIPFVYSTGQAYVVEMGEGYFRFHADGATLLHAEARQIASVDTGGDTITFTTPHGWASNTAVRFFNTGGAAPAGITAGTTYYVIPVDTHTVQISAFSGPLGAVDITGAGTGTTYGYSLATSPPVYLGAKVASIVGGTITAANIGTDEITTSVAHGITTGQPIRLTTTTSSSDAGVGAFPALSASVTYFAISTGTTTLKIATSLANALAGTAVDINSATLTGTPLVYRTQALQTGTAHGFATGDRVRFTVSSGQMYGGLAPDTDYNVTVESATVFKIDDVALQVDAFTGLGLGATSVSYDYERGDIVTYTDGFYTCTTDHPTLILPGTVSHWFEQSLDGVFELENDYTEAELFDVHYTQSGDIKTLAHPDHPPTELRRSGATEWDFTPITFNAALPAPTGATMTPTSGIVTSITGVTAPASATEASLFTVNTTTTPRSDHNLTRGEFVYLYVPSGDPIGTVPSGAFYVVLDVPNTDTFRLRSVADGAIVRSTSTTVPSGATVRSSSSTSEIANFYRVTAVDAEGRESPGSGSTGGINNLNQPGAYNTVTWSAVQGAVRYNVYRSRNNLWYFIGSTPTTSFVDDNISDDASLTLADADAELGSTGNFYPSAVCYFEGRRVFAGSRGAPQRVWMTNSGLPDSLSFHIPVRDDDRVVFDIESTEASTVQHLVPIQHLVAITNATEYRIGGLNTDPITPDNISVRPQSYVGGSSVQPIVVNRTIVFAGFMGSHVWEMGYTANDGYQPGDLTLRSPHLFDDYTVTDMAWSKSPVPVLWVTSSNGRLLGCTYAPEEQVGGWHVHTSATAAGESVFESVATIPEGNEYRLYAIVRRVIDGSTVRYIERMNSMYKPATLAESRHVDCGGQFYGVVTGTNISVTPASSWAAGATVTIASAAGPIFRLGSTDVGDRIQFDYLGRTFQATITSVASGISASATLVSAVTDANGTTLVYPTVGSITGISAWGWKRDSLSGLEHLEGEEVQVLADGVLSTKTVASGAITGISPPALRITYGTPIVSELLTLPVMYGSDSYGQARTSAVNEVWLRTSYSEPFEVGQADTGDENDRVPFSDCSFADAVKVARVLPRGRWDETGQLYVYQDQPYPLTLVSMTIKASIGS
jgi:hypothetical protein